MLLTDEAEEVRLAGPLTNLWVSIDCAIRVLAAGEDITLGPDLHLHGTSSTSRVVALYLAVATMTKELRTSRSRPTRR